MKKMIAFLMAMVLVLCIAVPAWAEENTVFEALLLPEAFGTTAEIIEDSASRAGAAAIAFVECILELQADEDEMDLSGLKDDCYIGREGSTVVFAFAMEDGDKVLLVMYNSLDEEYTAGIANGLFIAVKQVFEEQFNRVYTVDQEDLWDSFEIIIDILKEI